MTVSDSTAVVTLALSVLERGKGLLDNPCTSTPRRTEVAMGLLDIMSALANEYDPGHFTDEEIELISNITLTCLGELIIQQEGL